jgi:mannose-6-phosphate isomerase-like protein (cupin superfamily)
MSVRRVVTEEHDGRSRIARDEQAPANEFWEDLWIVEPGEPLGRPATDAQRMRELMAGHVADDAPDVEAPFHRTSTLDLIYVLDGEIDLVLDDGEVHLQPGDCVVQQHTNHAWRNLNDHPVRLLGLMTTLPAPAAGS